MGPVKIKETVFDVDYGWLERTVKEKYGQKFCFVSSMECGNDTSHRMTVDGRDDDPEELQKFKDTGYSWCITAELLMNDMCRDGELEPGIYVVEVCW